MKKMITTILFTALFSSLTAPPYSCGYVIQGEAINPYIRIMNAVTTVESTNGKYLLNAKENAVGWFGIRPIRLNDYNKKTGKHITLDECYSFETGRMIFLYYASQYDYRDIKGICVSWNGVSKENKYYAKIRAEL